MIALVSVGSTGFDALAEEVVSTPFLDVLHRKGCVRLIFQCGNSIVKLERTTENEDHAILNIHGIEIEIWKFKPSLRVEMEAADIIISHAGSGTIMEALCLRKPLIVVPNPTLLDDHQQELAQALEALGCLKTSTVASLAETLSAFDPEEMVPLPQADSRKFAKLVDEEMGF